MDYLQTAHYFSILYRRSHAFFNKWGEQWQLGHAEFVVLHQLLQADGITQDELNLLLLADKSQVARNVKALEAKGYVCRLQDEKDHRYKRIFVTGKAKDIEADLFGAEKFWLKELIKGIPPEIVEQTAKGLKLAFDNAMAFDFSRLGEKGANEYEKK